MKRVTLSNALLLVAGIAAVACCRSSAAQPVPRKVLGETVERADYEMRRPDSLAPAVPCHAVAGFEQRSRLLPDGRTHVTVLVSPPGLVADDPWPARPERRPSHVLAYLADTESAPAVRELAASLSRGATRQHEVSWRLLEWIAQNIVADAETASDESAGATLALRRGSCVGRSRLAVALLRAAGIPARTVHALLVPGNVPAGADVGSAEFQLHRFVESWIDGIGWLPSDPGQTIHAVDARHVVLAVDDELYDPEAQRGLVLRAVAPSRVLELPSQRSGQ